MKVLLMVPLTSLMKHYPDIPDLGLGYLATAVRKAGFQVEILGWNNNLKINEFKDYLKKTHPNIVGIKVFTHNIGPALKTVSIIKTVNPSIITVIGGPHPSASNPSETMDDFKDVDFAFRGDAEIGFSTLVKEISILNPSNGRRLPDIRILKEIPGLIWKDQYTVHANLPYFPENLDDLGLPSWDLIDPRIYNFYRIDENDRQGHVAPIIATRGCPLSCTYCSVALVNGKEIRRRSISSLIEEIELLYNKYNVRQLTIMDTSFLSDKYYVKNFCNSIIEKGLKIKWDCICDTLNRSFYNDGILDLMFKAGCRKIIMGIESGSNKILKVIKKVWSKEQFRELVPLIKSHGISVQGYFMFGFPYETKEEMKKTRDFSLKTEFDSIFYNICYPLPGTKIYEYLKKKYQIDRINWKDFIVEKSPYPVSEVSSREIMKFLYQTEFYSLLNSSNISKNIFKRKFLLNFSKLITKYMLLLISGSPKKIKQC